MVQDGVIVGLVRVPDCWGTLGSTLDPVRMDSFRWVLNKYQFHGPQSPVPSIAKVLVSYIGVRSLQP